MSDSDTEGFFAGARAGEIDAVRAALSAGVAVDLPDEGHCGETALMYAARGGHRELVRLLIEAGANVSARDDKDPEMAGQRRPLHHAMYSSGADTAEELLDAGADPNVLDSHGETPLNRAIEEGNVAALRLLLAHGADVRLNPRSKRYRPPLCVSAVSGNADALDLLLDAGGDPDAAESLGQTPLFFLAHAPEDAAARMAQALLRAGAAVDVVDQWNGTPLLTAVLYKVLPVISLLLAAGADVNRVFTRGTALDIVEQDIGHLERQLDDPAFSGPARDVALQKQQRNREVLYLLLSHGARRNDDL